VCCNAVLARMTWKRFTRTRCAQMERAQHSLCVISYAFFLQSSALHFTVHLFLLSALCNLDTLSLFSGAPFVHSRPMTYCDIWFGRWCTRRTVSTITLRRVYCRMSATSNVRWLPQDSTSRLSLHGHGAFIHYRLPEIVSLLLR
jgi:hypothetical protein